MAMKPHRKKRLIHIIGGISIVAIVVYLVIFAADQNMNLFRTPTQIANGEVALDQMIRIGGLVKDGSVRHINREDASLEIHFTITDLKHDTKVVYNKVLPDLFREGQGIVALGRVNKDGIFFATEVLAKHDEEYKAPEVLDALEQAGHPVKTDKS